MKVSIVVAAGDNNAIGQSGKLLWHLPNDMRYFKQITMGHHVIMGRKTYESIPEKYRPLIGRVNVVVTRQKDYEAPGCRVVSSVEDALKFAEANEETEVMVIGGGEIYREAFKFADRIYFTKVYYGFPNADTHFPEMSKKKWELVLNETYLADEKHLYEYDFQVWDRKPEATELDG